MVDLNELRDAIIRAKEKGAGDVSESLARSVVAKVADKKERMKFHEAIRYSLNELRIFGEERKSYSKIIGCFFGKRGGHVAARRAREATPAKPPRPSVTGTYRLDQKSGQYEFLV